MATVVDVVRQNGTKRGLALVVTNDYSDGDLPTLTGPRKDGERIQRVFNELGIATLWKRNVGHDELVCLLREVAGLQAYPANYKSISFVFSGHGQGTGEINMQDGRPMGVQEIVDYLLPQRAPNIGNIPKLFFIDACRGSEEMQPIFCQRGGGGTSSEPVQDRGATDATILVPPDGNTLVAYSTTNSNKAHELTDGGVWMKALAEKLRTSKQAIDTVLTEVRSELHACYQNPIWREKMQMPETINKLLKPVYFHPEADGKVPHTPTTVPGHAGEFTQRNPGHPGHYRGRLLNLEQRGIISDVKDTWKSESSGFTCTITFTHTASGRQMQFQSGRPMSSKNEAKESAAEAAVLSLDIESNGPMAGPGLSPKSSAKASAKDPVTQLKEYCEKKKITVPRYEEEMCDGAQQFKFHVTVQGKVFQGTVLGSKREAKKAAAQKAINGFSIDCY